MTFSAGLRLTLTRGEFDALATIIRARLGIALAWEKASFVVGRLETYLLGKGIRSFQEYAEALESDSTGLLLGELADRISTNYTYFNREREHFDFFRNRALPEIVERAKAERDPYVRVWCAASSTGEEPYMLAMLLHDFFGQDYRRWDVGVLATDISDSALKTATRGQYDEEQIAALPPAFRARYFLPLPGARFEVRPEIRKDVLFRRLNLMSSAFRFKRLFDVIFCRNVMIYFDEVTRADLVRRLCTVLRPGGYLIVGHAEPLTQLERSGPGIPLQTVQTSVHRRRP